MLVRQTKNGPPRPAGELGGIFFAMPRGARRRVRGRGAPPWFMWVGKAVNYHRRLVLSGFTARTVEVFGAGLSPLDWLHRLQQTLRLSTWSCPPRA